MVKITEEKPQLGEGVAGLGLGRRATQTPREGAVEEYEEEYRVKDRRVCLFAAYLDARKTVAQGRKIPKDAACDVVTCMEIHAACAELKLESAVENKSYPRDTWCRGRVRVRLFDDGGKPCNPAVPNRRTLMLEVAKLVPKYVEIHKKAHLERMKSLGMKPPPGAGGSGSVAEDDDEDKAKASKGSSSKSAKKGKKGRK